jgi:hypothetical protein
MLLAEASELNDLFVLKNSAHWVLGITKKKDLGVRGDLVFKRLPIEGPLSVYFNMIDTEEFHRGIMMDTEERGVDGGAGKNLLSGFSESSGGERERRDKAAKVNDFFFRAGVADSIKEIALESFDEGRMRDGIPENSMVDPSADGVDDFGWGGEIHVSNPKRVEIATAVPFERACLTSGDQVVEICHERIMVELCRGPITKEAKIIKLG